MNLFLYYHSQDIYCVVRRIVGFELFSCGGVLFHAAAVSINNKAVLIAGPKKVGKSTLANFLMFDCSAKYIAGDKTFCCIDNGSINCTGLISSIKIQTDSYSMTQSPKYKHLISFGKTNVQNRDKVIGGKATVNPKTFTDITCIDIIPKLAVETFIFSVSESDDIILLSKRTVRDCIESIITDDTYEEKRNVVKESAQYINSPVINRISNAVNCFSIPKYPSREMIFEFCKKNLF